MVSCCLRSDAQAVFRSLDGLVRTPETQTLAGFRPKADYRHLAVGNTPFPSHGAAAADQAVEPPFADEFVAAETASPGCPG
jgi:hypothetical protein